MESELSKLEKQALARKERLNELKRKRNTNLPENCEQLPKPQFRSYKPVHEDLNKSKIPETKPEDVTVEVKDQLEAAKQVVNIDHLDITTLAPRKQDWDLKRDISKKLEYLERKTQKAIAELIREELKKRQNLGEVASLDMPGSKLVSS
ncbi:hypothetical protein WA026_007668 [Henosepilachna vigintioctopunctata]|uniref:Coiled-coil domain-containing protein 12 n=1 Tax=Henosepilachna vigintioctopunctata TaxID=420089 RepID=A0AAW1TUQ9_9CUCU